MKSITQVVQNLLKPYIDNHDNAVAGNIAPVETNAASASKSYAVGEQLILGGVLYDVTVAITQGDALTVGTNIAVADDVVTQLASVNGALTNKLDNEIVTRSAMGAKNLLPNKCQTLNVDGVTYTVNNDGSITLSGTQSSVNNRYYQLSGKTNTLSGQLEGFFYLPKGKTYVFSTNGTNDDAYGIDNIEVRLIVNGSTVIHSYDTLANRTFEVTTDDTIVATIFVHSSAVADGYTFYPMIRLATDSDATYQPYAKTNRQLTEDSVTFDDLSEVGVVNYAPNILADKTVSGVTLTIDSDGVINQYSTGAPSAQITEIIGSFKLKSNHTYRLANQKDGSVLLRVSDLLIVRNKSTQTWLMATDNDTRLIYTPSEDVEVELVLRITTSASALDNVKFYPMVCPVSYNGPYVPYAKTNKELTDDLSTIIAGKPKQKIYRFAGGSTTTTITVPLDKVSSYAQGSLHIRTSSKDSEAHITFALNQGNTSVVSSEIKNYGTVTLSLDSITISGQVLTIVIGGGTAYEWYSAEYFASLSEGVTGEQPDWNFA